MLYVVSAPLFNGRPEGITHKLIVQGLREKGVLFKEYRDTYCDITDVADVYESRKVAHHQAQATAAISQLVKAGDTILMVEFYHPSIDAIFMMLAALNWKVRVVGVLHSSPYTLGDFLWGNVWGQDYHRHLVKHVDAVISATNYMKRTALDFPGGEQYVDKVHVTGLPVDLDALRPKPWAERKELVVYPHRWAADKNPQNFIRLARWWKQNRPDSKLEFVVFTPVPHPEHLKIAQDIGDAPIQVVYNATKEQYYARLGEVKFIWADSVLETFGYAVMEAAKSGVIPVLNRMGCYEDLYPDSVYDDFEGQVRLIDAENRNFRCNYPEGSVERIIRILEVPCNL